jgi:hypothetical protein
VYEHLGFRRIADFDDNKLRLFFLSLLWRAAASTLAAFSAVVLPDDKLEKLRQMVLHGDPEPYEFFPVCLTQLSTRNLRHNFSAERTAKYERIVDPTSGDLIPAQFRPVEVFRFYFDGLVAYFHIDVDDQYVHERAEMMIGMEKELCVVTVESEKSRQIQRLLHHAGMSPPTPEAIADEWADPNEDTDTDAAWEAMFEFFLPPSMSSSDGILHVVVDLDYDKYISHMGAIGKAWLRKDVPVEFYRSVGLILLRIVARKQAAMMTQSAFGLPTSPNYEDAFFEIHVTMSKEHGEEDRFLLLSWRFTKRLAARVAWSTLRDDASHRVSFLRRIHSTSDAAVGPVGMETSGIKVNKLREGG